MFALLISAVRARAGQAAALLLLTALAVTAITAAPWYAATATRSVSQAAVAAAAANHLAAQATGRMDAEGPNVPVNEVVDPTADDPAALDAAGAALLDEVRRLGAATIDYPGATASSSLASTGILLSGGSRTGISLTYRDRICDHLTIEGSCPQLPGQLLISQRTAERLRLSVGDQLSHQASRRAAVALTVTGLYQVTDPGEPYWAFSELSSIAGTDADADSGDPAFVTLGTLAAAPRASLTGNYHLVLPAADFVAGVDLATEVRQVSGGATGGWTVRTDAGVLVDLIERHRQLLTVGVAVAAGQLLLLSWFALFFAVRHTAEHRRRDLGLVKLRGGARWRVWLLTVGQSGLPMLAGALIGSLAGPVVARLLAGTGPNPDQVASAASLAAAAAATAVLGALVAAVAADLRNARASVVDLLRHVPARQRGWRGDAVDLIVVAIAAAGLYQAYTVTASSFTTASGLVLLSPALLALAVALIVGRLATPLASRAGAALLREGRLPAALAALHLARRPGTARLVALLTVAVALLGTAVTSWSVSDAARATRATHATGADQVLTVQTRSRAHLLAAVRAADPTGRHAMAVVRSATGASQFVLAVDASRLGQVAAWHPAYGSAAADVAAALAPPVDEVLVRDGELRLDATGPNEMPISVARQGPAPLSVVAHLVTPTGEPSTAVFGPLGTGRATYPATVSGCGPPGCRLAGLELVQPSWNDTPVPAAPRLTVHLHALAGDTAPRLDEPFFGDVRNWRGPIAFGVIGPQLVAEPRGLAVTTPSLPGPGARARTTRIQLVDGPVPVPVVRSGPELAMDPPGEDRLALFGGDALPVRFVSVADALPQARLRGYLVDLERADRLADGAGGGDVPQVWLGPDAPDDLIDRLVAEGLTVVDTESRAEAIDRLGRQGLPLALRFQLAAGLIGLLLAAGALAVVAAVERDDRAAELAALRFQGLPAGAVARIAYGGYAVIGLLAVVVGAVVTVVAQLPIQRVVPIFLDNWAVLPLRIGPQPVPVLASALIAALMLGVAGALAGTRLIRAVESRVSRVRPASSAESRVRPMPTGESRAAGRRPR